MEPGRRCAKVSGVQPTSTAAADAVMVAQLATRARPVDREAQRRIQRRTPAALWKRAAALGCGEALYSNFRRRPEALWVASDVRRGSARGRHSSSDTISAGDRFLGQVKRSSSTVPVLESRAHADLQVLMAPVARLYVRSAVEQGFDRSPESATKAQPDIPSAIKGAPTQNGLEQAKSQYHARWPPSQREPCNAR